MLLLQDLAASPSAPRTDKQERNIPKPWKYILAELKIQYKPDENLALLGLLVNLAPPARAQYCRPGIEIFANM